MHLDIWPAPAKLNLFLHILGRRPDGYHNLQTAFQLLQFGDDLQFDITASGAITLSRDYDLVPVEQDLIYRAAHLLKQKTGTKRGASIVINKRIPAGGGLGGGSSGAATTLVALNRLWGTGLTDDALATLGLQLGADVPVFIRGHSAWAEGVGEKLVPITLSDSWYLVIYPCVTISTSEAFNLPDLTRNTPPITIRDFLAGAGHNDCQSAVFHAWPEVGAPARWLDRWVTPRLTGTGSCVYGRFFGESSARAVLEKLPSKWQGFVSPGLNTSPLLDKLAHSGG